MRKQKVERKGEISGGVLLLIVIGILTCYVWTGHRADVRRQRQEKARESIYTEVDTKLAQLQTRMTYEQVQTIYGRLFDECCILSDITLSTGREITIMGSYNNDTNRFGHNIGMEFVNGKLVWWTDMGKN